MTFPGFTAEASLYSKRSMASSIWKAGSAPGRSHSGDLVHPAEACKDWGEYLICAQGCGSDPWCLLSCYYANCT